MKGGRLMPIAPVRTVCAVFLIFCFVVATVQAESIVGKMDLNTTTDETVMASLIASPLTGPAPLTVEFHDASTGNPTQRIWLSGDMPVIWYPFDQLYRNFTYHYQYSGIFYPTLIVKENGIENISSVEIRVIGPKPHIDSIKPSRHRHNGNAFKLVINGTGFQTARDLVDVPIVMYNTSFWCCGTKVIIWKTTPEKGFSTSLASEQYDFGFIALVRIPTTAKPGRYNVTVINPDGQKATKYKGFRILT